MPLAAGASQGTVRGAGMRQAQYARRIRAEFIWDPVRPAEVDRSNRDQCQWRPGACQGCGWAPFRAATHLAFREISPPLGYYSSSDRKSRRHIIQVERAYALISRAFARAGSIAPYYRRIHGFRVCCVSYGIEAAALVLLEYYWQVAFLGIY
jgi:hypothetical protein